MLYMINS